MSPVDVSDGSGAGNTAVNDDCEGDICEIHDFSHFRKMKLVQAIWSDVMDTTDAADYVNLHLRSWAEG